MLKEILNEIKLKSKSKLIKGWSKEFNVPEEYILIAWKWSICTFLENGKKGCKPKDSDWPIIVNIFKATMKKWLSKIDKDIKYVIKNPTIDDKKAHIHYEEARHKSLKKHFNEYKKQLKDCCSKCPKICSE